MREGPGGYVPTPGRPGAPALNERIAIALLADREAATAECEAAAAQMDFAAALAARPRLDYVVVSVAACMARNKRRRAALVRAEAWRRISEARYVAGVEARRWLYAAADDAAAVDTACGVRDGWTDTADIEALFVRLAADAGRPYPDVPDGASYLDAPDAGVALTRDALQGDAT